MPEIFPLSAFAFRRDRADGVGRDVPPASHPPATFATCRSPRRFDPSPSSPLASARDDAKAGLAAPPRRPPLGVLTHLKWLGQLYDYLPHLCLRSLRTLQQYVAATDVATQALPAEHAQALEAAIAREVERETAFYGDE